MKHLFDPENPFWNFMEKVMNAFLFSLLWLLGSLPLVTIGASTTALFQFTLKQTDDEEGYVWRSFWKAYWADFVPATGLWLSMVLAGAFLYIDFYACVNFALPAGIRLLCFAMIASLGVLYLLILLYSFPILSRFPIKTIKIPFHALVMAIGNPAYTILIILINGLFVLVIYYFPFMALFGMGLSAMFTSYFYRAVFRRYLNDDERNDGSSSC